MPAKPSASLASSDASALALSSCAAALADAALADAALFGDDAARRRWAIPDGAFAFATARNAAEAAGDVPLNAYGMLRAPWNNNPSPYVSRYPNKKKRRETDKNENSRNLT